MNAVQRARTVFRAEHSVLRQILSRMTSVLRAGEWRQQGPALDRLRELIEFSQLFDEVCHRPKSEILRRVVEHRSLQVVHDGPEIDDLLREATSLAQQVHVLLAAVARNEPVAIDSLPPRIERYQAHLLQRLQWEDRVLLSAAEALLGSREWLRIARGFDGIALPEAALYELDETRAPARRRVESAARFEDTGFALGAGLSFERVPLFR